MLESGFVGQQCVVGTVMKRMWQFLLFHWYFTTPELSKGETENFLAHVTKSEQYASIKIKTVSQYSSHHSIFVERGLWKCNTGQKYSSTGRGEWAQKTTCTILIWSSNSIDVSELLNHILMLLSNSIDVIEQNYEFYSITVLMLLNNSIDFIQ